MGRIHETKEAGHQEGLAKDNHSLVYCLKHVNPYQQDRPLLNHS